MIPGCVRLLVITLVGVSDCLPLPEHSIRSAVYTLPRLQNFPNFSVLVGTIPAFSVVFSVFIGAWLASNPNLTGKQNYYYPSHTPLFTVSQSVIIPDSSPNPAVHLWTRSIWINKVNGIIDRNSRGETRCRWRSLSSRLHSLPLSMLSMQCGGCWPSFDSSFPVWLWEREREARIREMRERDTDIGEGDTMCVEWVF